VVVPCRSEWAQAATAIQFAGEGGRDLPLAYDFDKPIAFGQEESG
jgi:hypothetical protein